MKTKNLYLGNTALKSLDKEVQGGFVEIQNEKFYKISDFSEMNDFFMTIVSNSDHWMYLSSNGALSAGRKNRDNALFPYYTVDKIHDYKGKTGSKTCCIVEKEERAFLWEPFSETSESVYSVNRNLYKSIYGNKIIFEEVNNDLGVSFQYSWANSEKYGWVRKSKISNISNVSLEIDVLDGIHNILPYGVDYAFQNEYSNLLDAYKKNELLEDYNIGLYMLSSIPVDRAEPSEALRTTTVWSVGASSKTKVLLSDKQLDKFCAGAAIKTEVDIRAARGAYYLNNQFKLAPKEEKQWCIVAEINQGAKDVSALEQLLTSGKNLEKDIEDDIALGTIELVKVVANADGVQLGNEELSSARHFSNTLFNVMRGGIYTNNYNINTNDLLLFVQQTNLPVATKYTIQIEALAETVQYTELIAWAEKQDDAELLRICYEYLPLTFSRRHGDPSRPWNQFSVEIKNEDGTDKLSYQGNWRDIFQNWEALSFSFPEYIEGIISKFVNASTPDGYNPYRITREGIDWECPDPNDPWAYIGYWGDHQIIYLQKFLEQSDAFHPGKLNELLAKNIFVYANVPYRIKPFAEIVNNPQDTILFDHKLNEQIQNSAAKIGADGRLLTNANGETYKVNLTEKILVTMLAKLSNFVPEAGIWLNTQRPEWNDANNALVGNGVSMVTLYYMRRFLKFWEEKFASSKMKDVEISEEVKNLLDSINTLFIEKSDLIETGFSDSDRYHFVKTLGEAGSVYREGIYTKSFTGKKTVVSANSLAKFCNLAIRYMEQSIRTNKREDGLYHAYNLISIKDKAVSVRYLYEMLEGQVAVLSAGYLSIKESLSVLDALKSSKLFREDQYSYLLYPNRELTRFIDKNNVPEESVLSSGLLQKLIEKGDTSIIKKDSKNRYHFDGTIRNAAILAERIEALGVAEYGDLPVQEHQLMLDIYEELFDHQSFTGRSGTFYGFEGLGSIYWHMVSKLLVAAQEVYFRGIKEGESIDVLSKLKDHYYEIKAGIGVYKSPKLYGAFPTDAYSHTPGGAGAKQPGLTGQVKEDVLARMAELGISVKQGEIHFCTSLVNHAEDLHTDATYRYFNVAGQESTIALKKGQFAFTFCQVPVVYTFTTKQEVVVHFSGGKQTTIAGKQIPAEISKELFERNEKVQKIEFFTTK